MKIEMISDGTAHGTKLTINDRPVEALRSFSIAVDEKQIMLNVVKSMVFSKGPLVPLKSKSKKRSKKFVS